MRDATRATRTIIVDFETRSFAPLKQVGAYIYAGHSTTSYLCLGYKFPGKKARVHYAHEPFPPKLLKAVQNGWFLEAHSAQFDRQIWNNVLCRAHPEVPHLPIDRWYCTKARTAYAGLPHKLKEAALILNLSEEKDDIGNMLINLLSKPNAIGEDGSMEFVEDAEALKKMGEYCRQDVETTAELSRSIPHLPAFERKVYVTDQIINDYGISIDRELCLKAVALIAELDKISKDQFVRITGIDSPTKRAKARAWLLEQGLDIPDTKKTTIDHVLKVPGIDPELKSVLKMITSSGRSSIAKYIAALNMAGGKNTIHGSLLYYGAHTGRFSGLGFQPQNFPRAAPEDSMEVACDDIKTLDVDTLSLMYDDPRELLSSCVRGMVVAKKNRYLYCGDLKSIEAIVLFWLAGEKEALKVFSSGGDIYCVFASYIFGRKITAEDEFERFMGKQAVLGLGYGMGIAKFIQTIREAGAVMSYENCVKVFRNKSALEEAIDKEKNFFLQGLYGAFVKKQIAKFHDGPIEEVLPEIAAARKIVGAYRKKYAKVPILWNQEGQDALNATQGNKAFGGWEKSSIGGNTWLTRDLPSGRNINYFNPKVMKKVNPSSGKTGPQLMYSSRLGDSSKAAMIGTFGGKIVENVIQAISRDVMVSLFKPLYDARFNISFTVHDEIIAESPDGSNSRLQEFEKIMTTSPQWAEDLPIMVSAKRLERYEK